jgi:hypothetical protein
MVTKFDDNKSRLHPKKIEIFFFEWEEDLNTAYEANQIIILVYPLNKIYMCL